MEKPCQNYGIIIVTGLGCVGGGDAQTQLDTLKEILSEIAENSGNTDSSFISKTFVSIKNLMSDLCATFFLPRKKLIIFFKNIVAQLLQMLLINGTLKHSPEIKM